MNSRMRIALELVRIAADLSPDEMLEEIDGMTIPQLMNTIRKNTSNYQSLSPTLKMEKLKNKVDLSKPVKRMTIKELFRLLAKIGVKTDAEEAEEQ